MSETQLAVSPKTAAKMLDCGLTTIYGLLRRGELEALYIGTARRILTSSITAYVERQKAAAKPIRTRDRNFRKPTMQ